MTPSPRYTKRIPAGWQRNFSLDLKSRPRFVPDLRPLSLTKLMRNRRVSKRNVGVRT